MYQETLDWLYQQLPQYQKEGETAYKADLENIQAITYLIGNPQENFKSIHIAGTNGKGSTAHMLASIFKEAGYTVGLYTSPHLIDFRERIKINGEPIEKNQVVEFVEANKEMMLSIKPSFFEWSVALAFHEFSRKKVDVAIIETGLGGKLDSTNIINPILSIITNIGLDHQNILGNTLEAIAKEKGGIIKHNTPVVIGETQEETIATFNHLAKKEEAPIIFADQTTHDKLPKTDLKGTYQEKNVKTVITAINCLNKGNWAISDEQISTGLTSVLKNTGLLGRWQIINKAPEVVLDVAHNKAGISQALISLQSHTYKSLHIVLALSSDKDRESVYKALPKNATYYFCDGQNPRLLPAINLRYEAVMHALHGKHYKTPIHAVRTAMFDSKQKGLVLVCGSNFLVGEVLEHSKALKEPLLKKEKIH